MSVFENPIEIPDDKELCLEEVYLHLRILLRLIRKNISSEYNTHIFSDICRYALGVLVHLEDDDEIHNMIRYNNDCVRLFTTTYTPTMDVTDLDISFYCLEPQNWESAKQELDNKYSEVFLREKTPVIKFEDYSSDNNSHILRNTTYSSDRLRAAAYGRGKYLEIYSELPELKTIRENIFKHFKSEGSNE